MSHLILKITCWVTWYFLHFTYEEVEAQRDKSFISRISLSVSLSLPLSVSHSFFVSLPPITHVRNWVTSSEAGPWKLFWDRSLLPLSLLIGTNNKHMIKAELIRSFFLEIWKPMLVAGIHRLESLGEADFKNMVAEAYEAEKWGPRCYEERNRDDRVRIAFKLLISILSWALAIFLP